MPTDSTKGGGYLSSEGRLAKPYSRIESYVMEPKLGESKRRVSLSSFAEPLELPSSILTTCLKGILVGDMAMRSYRLAYTSTLAAGVSVF